MRAGLGVQLGTAEEPTHGTAVVVDRFHEILSESLERRNNTLQSNGMRPGTRGLRRASRRVVSSRDGAGNISMEVATTGMGRWFKHMLGGAAAPVAQPGGIAFLHSYTLGEIDGKSLTVQKGVPQADEDLVTPFTFLGCKIPSWELSISVDQILQLALTLDAADVKTDIALAAASYGNVRLFSFLGGSIQVGGAPVAQVTNATVRGENPIKANRYYLGSGGVKKEQLTNDFPTVGGTVNAEFVDTATFYDRFAEDNGAALRLDFEGEEIEAGVNERLSIIIPEVHFTGETPKVGGPDVVVQNVPFEGLFDGTNVGTTIEYMTSDAAA